MAEGLSEPLPPALHALLRRAVLDHVTSEHRRSFLPLVHVGVPGRRETVFAVRPEERLDHSLRTDVVSAMVRRVREPGPAPLVWLTRRDDVLTVQDVDLAWLSAARSAYGELGLTLVMVVVNRHGWRDPCSGARRTWHRLRAPDGR